MDTNKHELMSYSALLVELQAGYVLSNHIELFATGRYEGGYGSKTYGDRDIPATMDIPGMV